MNWNLKLDWGEPETKLSSWSYCPVLAWFKKKCKEGSGRSDSLEKERNVDNKQTQHANLNTSATTKTFGHYVSVNYAYVSFVLYLNFKATLCIEKNGPEVNG